MGTSLRFWRDKMEAGVVRRKAIPRSRGRQKLKAAKNSKDNQENKKHIKCTELTTGSPFIPVNITPLVQSPQHPSRRAPLRQLKCGGSRATLTTSTPVTAGGSPKEGTAEQGPSSPPVSPTFTADKEHSELHSSSVGPAESLSWTMVKSRDDASLRQYHSLSYDTRQKRGKKEGAKQQQQKRRKSYQEEEFEEWVRQVNEEFEQIDKHELFITSTLQDS